MKLKQAKELFLDLAKTYFAGATVTITRQSRVPKPEIALVTLTFGNVQRPRDAVLQLIDGEMVGNYQSRMSVTVDLFTNGEPVVDDETGMVVAYEDTAVEDMLGFEDFLGSEYVIDWCYQHDVSILVDGETKSLTGVVNDTNYDYRSQVNVMFYFTQKAAGYTGVMSEDSIKYPTGEKDEETGEPTYTTKEPVPEESTTGTLGKEETPDDTAKVEPEFDPNPSGGGSEELGTQETGYFVEAEIKEDTGNG